MPIGARLRDWLARILPRWLAIALTIRRVSPPDGVRPGPWATAHVPPMDTGGAYRADNRQQDPSVDPAEPNGGESSSRGQDHGWSGCTMSSGATAMAYQSGHPTKWGGHLRHNQADLDGGTDLYDLRTAWSSFGHELNIKSGAGWAAVRDAHEAGRAIVVQGTGNVPGSESFDGGHACVIAPETKSDGRWLFGDPLADDWQWVEPSAIRTWMERWQSSCAFAVGSKPPPPPEPEPEPEPPPTPAPAPPPDRYATGYAAGLRDGRNLEADRTFASWHPRGRPAPGPVLWGDARWDAAVWTPPWPIPLGQLREAMTPAEWTDAIWAGALWRA